MAKKANGIVGCIRRSTDIVEVILALSPGEATAGVLGPVLDSPIQERCGAPVMSPVKGY